MYNNPLQYLTEKDQLIRNQLIPIYVEQDLFLEAIKKYFRYVFEKTKNLSNDQQIEIEAKLGTFIEKDANFQIMLDNFKYVSKFNYIMVTEFSQNYTFQPNFMLSPYSELNFDTMSLSQSYINLIQYFRNLDKGDKQSIILYNMYIDPDRAFGYTKNQYGMRLDMVIQNGQRISVYHDGRKKIQQKQRLENLDIMKENNQFRLSTNIETNFPIPENFDEFINKSNFRTIRFKQYQMFKYQFLEISISRVLQLDPMKFKQIKSQYTRNGEIDWECVMNYLIKELYSVTPFLQFKSLKENIINNPRKCEVEFEIHDFDFFSKNLDTFKRLQRNIDSFFQCDRISHDILYQQVQKIHPNAQRHAIQSPLIGNYLSTVYRMAQNYE